METPEQEEARIRAEVAAELAAEESGEAPIVDAEPPVEEHRDNPPDAPLDPWEGVNPAIKKAFDEMSSRVATLQATEQRLKQAESRIGSITNELHAARKVADSAVKSAPTAAQIEAAAASDEKWEALKTDFPEWAEAFDGRFDKKLAASVKELREAIKAELKEEVGGNTAENLDLKLLSVVKRNWRTTIASKEWKDWLVTQPPERQALVNSEKAEDAIDLIDSFEQTQKQPAKTATEIAAERKQRMKQSVLPQGGKATPPKSEADMSAAELRAKIGREVFANT
jgi:hypothetical protein